MLPPVAAQVTVVLLEPFTVAMNCWVPPVGSEAEVGWIVSFAPAALTGEHPERPSGSNNSKGSTHKRLLKAFSSIRRTAAEAVIPFCPQM